MTTAESLCLGRPIDGRALQLPAGDARKRKDDHLHDNVDRFPPRLFPRDFGDKAPESDKLVMASVGVGT
jgi:hypothetical protein